MVKAHAPRILVVDDDLSAALRCTYALLDAEFEVDLATTRADALHLLAERRYAAHVIDLVMPDLAGYQLIHTVRTAAPGAALVVMGDDPEPSALRPEPDAYLARPFSPVALLDAVSRALVHARRRATSPGADLDHHRSSDRAAR